MAASRIPKEKLQIDAELQRLTEKERESYWNFVKSVGFEPTDPNYPAFTLTFISYCLTMRVQEELSSTAARISSEAARIVPTQDGPSSSEQNHFWKGFFFGVALTVFCLCIVVAVFLIASELPVTKHYPSDIEEEEVFHV